MPAVHTIISILKKAGNQESGSSAAKAGFQARNLRGFRVQPSTIERRVVHVYHVGRGVRAGLDNYEAALKTAGLIVDKQHGGLRITSRRSIDDRGKL